MTTTEKDMRRNPMEFADKSFILEKYNITEKELHTLVEIGDVKTCHQLHIDGNVTVLYYTDDVAWYVADRDIVPANYAHLNTLMNINEAALKYQISSGTVSRWAKTNVGYLNVQKTEGNRKMVREGDVAYLVDKARASKMRSGKRWFSPT